MLCFNAVSGARLKRTVALFDDSHMCFAIRLTMVITDASRGSMDK